jgi:hypothetical protein
MGSEPGLKLLEAFTRVGQDREPLPLNTVSDLWLMAKDEKQLLRLWWENMGN